MSTLKFAVGETLQTRTYSLLSGPNVSDPAVDLTNANTGRVIIGGSFPTATKSVTLTKNTTGVITLELDSTQLTVAGHFPFTTEITWNDGTITKWPKPGYDYIDVGGNPP